MNSGHSSIAYASELEHLRERFILMVQRTADMVEQSCEALDSRDAAAARRIVDSDRFLDRLEVEVDEKCLVILARHNPLARDLRRMITLLKAVTDLERIGDLCTSTARHILHLGERRAPDGEMHLNAVRDVACRMMRLAVQAITEEATDVALDLLGRDDELDHHYMRLLKMRFHAPASDEEAETALRLLLIAKNFERIGDHCTNLAEQVVFLSQSEDIRHNPSAGRALRDEDDSSN